jgi:glycosyltransferase involved in cell wall biosynthesis
VDPTIKQKGIPVFSDFLAASLRIQVKKIKPEFRAKQLADLIYKIKPDIIHSLEMQAGAYLTLKAKKIYEKTYREKFPCWIITNWGSDIYIFGRLPEHKDKIRESLENCDFYSCECERDIPLAQKFNLKGEVLPVFPNTGGFDLDIISQLRQPGPVSKRRFIMLKGYQGWAGRNMTGLRALERCAELLQGYTLVVYSADETSGMITAAKLFSDSTGVPVIMPPIGTPHQEILSLHGKSRISIGLNISDGISTSFLEALVMGSFPVQSWTACADEWITDAVSGLLVPPEDPEIVEKALRKALTDDELVDKAAIINYRTAEERLEKSLLIGKTLDFYRRVMEKN